MGAAIAASGLCKRFGATRAVHRLTLEVESGEVFGFLGPNGAGKTTTIRMLLGFLFPSAGTASVLGEPCMQPGVRARIGYLPADLRLPVRYTGRDVFELFGALRGGVDEAWRDELIDRLDLDPSRPIGQLSTGNRRKVGIVCAFMHRPELLILDEPTSGLDPLLQREFESLVAQAVAGGTTVFLSSHVLPEVERVADCVGILRQGELVTVAGIDELRCRARQTIALQFDDEVDPASFEAVPGVVKVKLDRGALQVVIEGSADALIKKASEHTVHRIVTEEADLQDMFFELYKEPEP